MSCDPKVVNRLKRSEGQLRGIMNMMEQGKECQDIIVQLLAVRASIDKTIGVIVTENIKECLEKSDADLMNEKLRDALGLISKTS